MGEVLPGSPHRSVERTDRDAAVRCQTGDGDCVPSIELVDAIILRDVGEGLATEVREIRVPAVRLSFVYPWGRVRALDERARVVEQPSPRTRDGDAERAAGLTLEGLGLVEARGDHGAIVTPESDVDYLVDDGVKADAGCWFSMRGVSRLRDTGWEVIQTEAYPHLTIEGEAAWRGSLRPSGKDAGWFELQLGVEVEGGYVDLLEPLLELLAEVRGAIEVPRGVDYTALPLGGERTLVVPSPAIEALLSVLRELYEIDPSNFGHVAVPML
ncbi:MAG: hypothetical protein ACPHRO_05745, partial [Nannocystaceae bacterium]